MGRGGPKNLPSTFVIESCGRGLNAVQATAEPVLAEGTQISALMDDLTREQRNLPAVFDNNPLHDYYLAIAFSARAGWALSWG
jgi:hypothetical protein